MYALYRVASYLRCADTIPCEKLASSLSVDHSVSMSRLCPTTHIHQLQECINLLEVVVKNVARADSDVSKRVTVYENGIVQSSGSGLEKTIT